MQLPLFQLSPAEQQAWLRERFERPAPTSATNLSDGFRLPGREGMTTPAAVLVPLVNRPEGLTVLFTERSADLPDHPGQISFPGGRIEREDADAIAADDNAQHMAERSADELSSRCDPHRGLVLFWKNCGRLLDRACRSKAHRHVIHHA
jgi:hypothetical protein